MIEKKTPQAGAKISTIPSLDSRLSKLCLGSPLVKYNFLLNSRQINNTLKLLLYLLFEKCSVTSTFWFSHDALDSFLILYSTISLHSHINSYTPYAIARNSAFAPSYHSLLLSLAGY